jgi:UDP:flavonoid glycosyltransferase YjiC (YdhE family)
MAIVLLAIHWTGGDVFPFLHMEKTLKERGHNVILFTHCHYTGNAAALGTHAGGLLWDDWASRKILWN